MLTGCQAFVGETVSDTLAAVLKEDPDYHSLPGDTPPSLHRLLRRCLVKNPQRRLRHIGDAAFELIGPEDEENIPAVSVRPPRWPWVAVGLSLLTVVVLGWILLGRESRTTPPRFTRLTFQRGAVTGAAFTADGQTVVYSAALGGAEERIFLRRLDSYTPIDLDLEKATVVDASAKGQLSVLVPSAEATGRSPSSTGNLAVGAITGGGLREVAEGVHDADFAPDGSIAVSRRTSAAGTVEYPIGVVLAEVEGQSLHVAVSPDGKMIAFVDGPIVRDTRGTIAVADRDGKVRHLTKLWEHVGGLAWMPDSSAVVFSATDVGMEKVYSVTLDGQLDCRVSASDSLTVMDVAPDGRLLVMSGEDRIETWFEGPDGTKELTIRGSSFPFDLSADGSMFVASAQFGKANYEAFFGLTDGSSGVALGQGSARALSPDGRWVVGTMPVPFAPLTLWPTGAGSKQEIALDMQVQGVKWHPDGTQLVVAARRRDGECLLWRVDVAGGVSTRISDRPVIGDPILRFFISPDGNRVVALDSNRVLTIFPLDGGAPRMVPGAAPGHIPVGWGMDNSVFVINNHIDSSRQQVIRIDLESGATEPFREIGPPDPIGVESIGAIEMTADGSAALYCVFRRLGHINVVEGW
jgi:Tol biopolymer transport system component